MAKDALGYCCCCHTSHVGAYLTLCIHFVINVLILVTTIGDVIAENTSLAWTSLPLPYQIALGAYAIAGMPIILGGFYGVYHRIESTVRIYWFFLISVYVVELFWVAYTFIVQGPCRNVDHMGMPKAFGCGFLRVLNIIVIAFLVLVPLHFIMLLGTFVKDISVQMEGSTLGDLVQPRDMKGKLRRQRYYDQEFEQDFASLHEQVGLLSAERPVGRSIFGGKSHDTEYPPSRDWA